ncbi:MAG: type II toxin-antitoxin system prevent-host-death family antitoxin [Syntrophobacteraceae bacterium]
MDREDRKEKRNRIVIEDLDVVTATDAKNKFGELLHRVCYDKIPVLVEKSGRPMAVMLDYGEYLKLRRQAEENKPVNGL